MKLHQQVSQTGVLLVINVAVRYKNHMCGYLSCICTSMSISNSLHEGVGNEHSSFGPG